jgi:hypothetical protein
MRSEWILGRLAGGGCGWDATGSGDGLVASSYDCNDEPSSSCATDLFICLFIYLLVDNLSTLFQSFRLHSVELNGD